MSRSINFIFKGEEIDAAIKRMAGETPACPAPTRPPDRRRSEEGDV